MTDVDYADNLALLVSTPAQTKSLQYSLEQAAWDIGLYSNTNKTEFLYFQERGAITTLTGMPLKLIDQFSYFDCNNLIDWNWYEYTLSEGMNSWEIIDHENLISLIKRDSFQAVAESVLL